jgi:hypothetical protein
LEWIRRNKNDEKTYEEIFYVLCEDIQDMDFVEALQSLMSLFVDQIKNCVEELSTMIKSQSVEWIDSQAPFIRDLFQDIRWES